MWENKKIPVKTKLLPKRKIRSETNNEITTEKDKKIVKEDDKKINIKTKKSIEREISGEKRIL